MDNVQVPATSKAPGIVLFVSIISFIFSGIWALAALTLIIAMIVGGSAVVYDQTANLLSRAQPPINMSFGVAFFFIFALVASLAFTALFLTLGIGLLRRKHFAWYLQVTLSVLGLLGFPFFTILNGVILVFFFKSTVRNYFNV